jgi:hypothetical protein
MCSWLPNVSRSAIGVEQYVYFLAVPMKILLNMNRCIVSKFECIILRRSFFNYLEILFFKLIHNYHNNFQNMNTLWRDHWICRELFYCICQVQHRGAVGGGGGGDQFMIPSLYDVEFFNIQQLNAYKVKFFSNYKLTLSTRLEGSVWMVMLKRWLWFGIILFNNDLTCSSWTLGSILVLTRVQSPRTFNKQSVKSTNNDWNLNMVKSAS